MIYNIEYHYYMYIYTSVIVAPQQRCRRAQILEYLGERPDGPEELAFCAESQLPPARGTPGHCSREAEGAIRCGYCDVCTAPAPPLLRDLCGELAALLRCAAAQERHTSRCQLLQFLLPALPGGKLSKDTCALM